MRSECLVIGGWQPAIWLDSNINLGTSGTSNTFDNLPLSSPEFRVKDLEVWTVSGSLGEERREGSDQQAASSESLAYRRWRNMEDSRGCRVARPHGTFGSPCIENETFFLKKKQFEASAENISRGSLVLEIMSLTETERPSSLQQPLSDLTSSFTLGQDWTNSLHL